MDPAATSQATQTGIHTVDATEALETVFPELAESRAQSIIVTDSGHLVGLLTSDSVATFLMLQTAARKSLLDSASRAA
jgi:CBS-domain-containing membrane protein